jgi:drug/metabolite transporter (DMT)-like permease
VLPPAASFAQFVLAIHIIAVVVAFGVTFSYPLFAVVGARLDPKAMPWFHRMQQTIGRRLISPGLGVVLIAGIVLASDEHQWKHFYVQWGIAAVIVLGALEGAVMTRGEGRLAEIAERDVAAAGAGQVSWSAEYDALFRRLGAFGALMDLIVVVTIFFMALHV